MKWIAFSFSVIAVFATAQTIDFRGVPMGAKEKLLREKAPFLKCRNARPDDPTGDRRCSSDFDGRRAPENAQFADANVDDYVAYLYADQLSSLTVFLDSEDYERVREAMQEKFGKPSKIDTPEYKTQGGLTVTNEIVTWDRPDSFVRIKRYFYNIRKSIVEYEYKPLQGEYEKRAKELTKKRAKTL